MKDSFVFSKKPTIDYVINELWLKSADHFSKNELEWLASAKEHAETILQNIETTMEGIGCYVASDEDQSEKKSLVGSFQSSKSTSNLLFFFADSVRFVRSVLQVSEAANSQLQKLDVNPESAFAERMKIPHP